MRLNIIQCWRHDIQPSLWENYWLPVWRWYCICIVHSTSYGATTIDSPYVGGVSLTRGAQEARQHIWTFAAGLTQIDQSDHTTYLCPCSTTGTMRVPTLRGE